MAADLGAPVHGLSGRVEAPDIAFDDTAEHLRALFLAGTPIVAVAAVGIVVRALASVIGDKRVEPPVVAVADDGSVAVPLLGGHRGANALARRVAAAVGATAAITTAGDLRLGVALDAPPPGWRFANPEDAKPAMAALLAGGGATVVGADAACADWLDPLPRGEAVQISCTMAPVEGLGPRHLHFAPTRLALGVGAARNCPPDELWRLVEGVLAEAGASPFAVHSVNTIDVKADEPAILALAHRLGVPLRLFPASALEAEAPRLANPSAVVMAEVGCHGVAEGAALLQAGPTGRLLVEKRKSANATAALAIADAAPAALAGRPRGRLSVVGIGPGQAAWRTPEVSRILSEADELVGYGFYIDLLGPLAAGKPRADFDLGGEEARCRHALERAAEGRNVALVCSGDAGIYAMASLVFELLDRPPERGGVSLAARRVEVTVAPGITALQAAAARAGAPIGHDFCAISLSDLLTPRADILRRLRAAAEGDFVIAFYNPVSRRRRTLLAEAREILLEHRPPDTPVILARSLGRPDETVRTVDLADLSVDDVDMMTLVLVGAARTRRLELAEGTRVYTPRGYERKLAGGEGADPDGKGDAA